MKIVAIILTSMLFVGCSTIKQAQTDFTNLERTINLNLNKPVVHKNAYF